MQRRRDTAAQVRDHRLRQARRQGAGLRVATSTSCSSTTTTTTSRAQERYARFARTPHHLADERDRRPASSTTSTCACAPTARPGCWSRRSPASGATSASNTAWTWEHQALTRARFVAGDAPIGAAFEEEREAILRLPRDPQPLRDEVVEMRATDARRPSEPDAALRPQARRGRHGRRRVRRPVPRARARARAPRSSRATWATSRCSGSPATWGSSRRRSPPPPAKPTASIAGCSTRSG